MTHKMELSSCHVIRSFFRFFVFWMALNPSIRSTLIAIDLFITKVTSKDITLVLNFSFSYSTAPVGLGHFKKRTWNAQPLNHLEVLSPKIWIFPFDEHGHLDKLQYLVFIQLNFSSNNLKIVRCLPFSHNEFVSTVRKISFHQRSKLAWMKNKSLDRLFNWFGENAVVSLAMLNTTTLTFGNTLKSVTQTSIKVELDFSLSGRSSKNAREFHKRLLWTCHFYSITWYIISSDTHSTSKETHAVDMYSRGDISPLPKGPVKRKDSLLIGEEKWRKKDK